MENNSEFDQSNNEDAEINIAPLVDVCLVMVLIFMVTAPFLSKTLMPLNLPKAVTAESESQENITISLSPKEGYAINEVPLQKSAVEAELRRHLKKANLKYILIRADERIPHGDVEELLKMSKRLGAHRVAFATVPKG